MPPPGPPPPAPSRRSSTPTRPASSPGAMSPPAGSQSATSNGPGHPRANAQVEVLTPGAAFPEVTTVSISSPPRRQQDQRHVAGRGELGHPHAVVGADSHVDHRHLRGLVERSDLGDRRVDLLTAGTV